MTIVIVTHNMQQAARVSDYTAYMYLGELIEFGVTDEIFIKPKKKQTEDYITGQVRLGRQVVIPAQAESRVPAFAGYDAQKRGWRRRLESNQRRRRCKP